MSGRSYTAPRSGHTFNAGLLSRSPAAVYNLWHGVQRAGTPAEIPAPRARQTGSVAHGGNRVGRVHRAGHVSTGASAEHLCQLSTPLCTLGG